MRRRAFIKRASGLLVPFAFPAIIRAQGIPEPILSLLSAPSPAAATGDTPLVTAQTLGTLRSNFSGQVGFSFVMPNVNLTCTALARWVVSGNTGTHTVRITNAGACTTQTSVSVNTNGQPVGYLYVTLGSPITLLANNTYTILSIETNGGDQWYDADTSITIGVGSNPSAVNSDGVTCNTGTVGKSYGPVNLKYH